jgi:hypothetical protein
VEAITGLDYWKTHVLTNNHFKEVPDSYSCFAKLRAANPEYWLGCIFSKDKHTGDEPGEPWRPLKEWAAQGGLNYYYNASANGKALNIAQTNQRLNAALAKMKRPAVLFCHWADPDITGHKFGMDSQEYCQSIIELDNTLGQAYAVMQPDVVLIYSDHGFDGAGQRGHNNAPHGLFASNLPINACGARRDVAYTLLRILRLDPDGYHPRLNGKSLLG